MSGSELLDRLANAITAGDETGAKTTAENIVDLGLDPLDAIRNGAMRGMDVVGKKFQDSEIFLPDVMLAVDAMKATMSVLLPKIAQQKKNQLIIGKVVIGTVMGDIHDIGKNIVSALLSVAGFEVYDLGVDVAPKRFVEKAEEVGADVIALSSLLSTSLYYEEDVIRLLRDMKIRNKHYMVVGGGPVTQEWAERIGADGYGRRAHDGVKICRALVTEHITPPLLKPLTITSEGGYVQGAR